MVVPSNETPPCGALENWIYDCREINDMIGPLETEEDIDLCQKHYTAVRGPRDSELSKDPVFCEAQNGQCLPGPDVCGLTHPPFEPQTFVFGEFLRVHVTIVMFSSAAESMSARSCLPA